MSILDDLRDGMRPVMTPDLDVYLQACASMFAPVERYYLDTVVDGVEYPGWSSLFDVDRCPVEALPYLAQLVGETLDVTLTDVEARRQIRTQPNRRRGTKAGIIAAARATLSDPDGATVVFRERDAAACPSEPGYGVTVVTYTSQTPNPSATEAAIRANIPAGIILNYETLDGWDIAEFEAAGYADIAAFEAAAFTSIDQFEVNLA